MADLLPVDTTSPAIANLAPSSKPDTAAARTLWAERDLRVHALNAGMTADEYRKAGLLAEQWHQVYDLDADSIPFPGAVYDSYLQLGGQS